MSRKASCALGGSAETPSSAVWLSANAPDKPGEVDGFPGAARRVRAWIEKQHEVLARIVGQGDDAAAVARQAESGRLCTRGQSGHASGLWVCLCIRPVADGRFSSSRLCCGLLDRAGPGFNGFEGPYAMLRRQLSRLSELWSCPTCSPVFVRGVLADVTDRAPGRLAEAGLGDFLRVFLDIRLPFVAFGGSIMGIAGLVLANWNQAGRWASLMAPEYGYKEFDAPPIRSLTALAGPDDE